jgi:hypothetical protein
MLIRRRLEIPSGKYSSRSPSQRNEHSSEIHGMPREKTAATSDDVAAVVRAGMSAVNSIRSRLTRQYLDCGRSLFCIKAASRLTGSLAIATSALIEEEQQKHPPVPMEIRSLIP